MSSGVSLKRMENFRFGGRQFHRHGFSDCFVKAGFIAVVQFLFLSIYLGYESPQIIYCISPHKRVFDKMLSTTDLKRGRNSIRVQFVNHRWLHVLL